MRAALLSVLHLSLTLGPALAQPSAGSPMKWTVKAGDTPGVASCSMRAPGPVNLALVRSEYGVALKVSGTPWTASRDVVSATAGDVRVSADAYTPLTISLLSRDPSSAQFLRALEIAPSISLMQGVRTVVVRLEGTTEGLAALDVCMQQQSRAAEAVKAREREACDALMGKLAAAVGGTREAHIVRHVEGDIVVGCGDSASKPVFTVGLRNDPKSAKPFLDAVLKMHPHSDPQWTSAALDRCIAAAKPFYRIRGKGGRSHVPSEPTSFEGELKERGLKVTCRHAPGGKQVWFGLFGL